MRVTVGAAVLAGLLTLSASAFAADQVLKFPDCAAFSVEYLHDLAKYALQKRRYNIEEDTPTMLVGEQDKLKVEMIIEPGSMVIRWKEGFGHPKDIWLRNLKTDVLWRMVE